jgi:hypothetical protein
MPAFRDETIVVRIVEWHSSVRTSHRMSLGGECITGGTLPLKSLVFESAMRKACDLLPLAVSLKRVMFFDVGDGSMPRNYKPCMPKELAHRVTQGIWFCSPPNRFH